jgi:hypothetical protein
LNGVVIEATERLGVLLYFGLAIEMVDLGVLAICQLGIVGQRRENQSLGSGSLDGVGDGLAFVDFTLLVLARELALMTR